MLAIRRASFRSNTSDYSGSQYGASSYADLTDFRDRTNIFEELAAFTEISTTLRSEDQSDRAFGLLVSENYFDLLGVKAARGRTFQHDDEGTLVVSYSFWQKRFGCDEPAKSASASRSAHSAQRTAHSVLTYFK